MMLGSSLMEFVMREYYQCPDCGGEEAVERIKLHCIKLTTDFPKYEPVITFHCAKCGTEWLIPYHEIIHLKLAI